MKRVVYVIPAVLILGYAGLCVAMYSFQRSLLYFPQPSSVTAPESSMTLPVDGAEIVVTVRRHNGPRAIVYFGGNGEDVSRHLSSFDTEFPDYALYLMHYRGYGGSTGKPTEKANVADGIALFEKVRALHPEVAIVGRSLGSGVAIQVASHVAASRLVLVTPFDSVVGIAARVYWYLPVRWIALDTYESGKFAPGITIPTTIIAAGNDQVVPRASTEKLLSRFKPGIATMTVIDGVGHDDIQKNEKYVETLQAALK
ncbi:MAG TPA: alpha/beta hydrolase [Rhodanobacteraceae bacterium]|nr:alpha/beta hydrolase [Rhodanobacteraceae bacterium]